MNAIKQEAKKLIDNIPDNEITSWDDVMYEFYVKKKIEIGLKADKEGQVISHEEVEKKFLNR